LELERLTGQNEQRLELEQMEILRSALDIHQMKQLQAMRPMHQGTLVSGVIKPPNKQTNKLDDKVLWMFFCPFGRSAVPYSLSLLS
jgi:hypothetical protein